MKNMIQIAAVVLLVMGLVSCKEENVTIPDSEIATNLAASGQIDLELLVGEWQFVRFAHTADGKKVTHHASILKGTLAIPFSPIFIENINIITHQWMFGYDATYRFVYRATDNFLDLNLFSDGCETQFPEIQKVVDALKKAYSFVVVGDELIIHYIGDAGSNLLIFNKEVHQKDENQRLPDAEIAYNLSKEGTFDAELLVGQWQFVRFAYTADGYEIFDRYALLSGMLTIPTVSVSTQEVDGDMGLSERWMLTLCASDWFIWSLDGYFLNLELRGSEFLYCPQVKIQETLAAFPKAYSFIIRGNELFIHYVGDENKNLLILKKCKR
jgi:hypothetical protein